MSSLTPALSTLGPEVIDPRTWLCPPVGRPSPGIPWAPILPSSRQTPVLGQLGLQSQQPQDLFPLPEANIRSKTPWTPQPHWDPIPLTRGPVPALAHPRTQSPLCQKIALPTKKRPILYPERQRERLLYKPHSNHKLKIYNRYTHTKEKGIQTEH